MSGIWIAVMEGEPLTERTYNHVAFEVRVEDLDCYKTTIERLGLEVFQSRPRVEGEGCDDN